MVLSAKLPVNGWKRPKLTIACDRSTIVKKLTGSTNNLLRAPRELPIFPKSLEAVSKPTSKTSATERESRSTRRNM